nr:MAG TPA: hypothetical protein [Caudoviricetes sp.]
MVYKIRYLLKRLLVKVTQKVQNRLIRLWILRFIFIKLKLIRSGILPLIVVNTEVLE